MKTITEFSGFVLKEALAKKAALIAEGKSEEEVQAAINEQLKLDETKTPFYKNAVDMTSSRLDQVKRVVVALKATETEKVPTDFAEREGHFYLVEYFPGTATRAPRRDDRDNDRFGGRGKGGKGGGGRGGNDRGRGGNDRGGDRNRSDSDRPRREYTPNAAPVARPSGTFAARDPNAPAPAPRAPRPPREQKPRAPRPPRDANAAPRGPRSNANRGPQGAGELRLILKGQTQTTLQGSGNGSGVSPATASASAETATTSETPQASS